jgi:O-antigen/teichoic acid export membrane protein
MHRSCVRRVSAPTGVLRPRAGLRYGACRFWLPRPTPFDLRAQAKRVGQDRAVTTPPKQLGARIVRGSAWTAARQAVQQACGLSQLVLVARLVPPAEVGLFSMATLVLTITRALTETGFEQALIQRAELDEDTLDVGFSVVLLRALLVALVMFLGARLFAGFFAEPRVADLLRVLALGMLLEGFVNNRVAMFQRVLDFRRYFFFHAAGQLVGLAVTIVAAALLRNVWAVVYGQLAGAAARVTASYLLERRRPRLRLHWATARELLSYGRWVGASSILLFLLVNGDNLFIGKVIGATELAYYAWAYQLANLPALFITQVLSSVLFPALSSLRAEPQKLGQLYLRSMRLTWLLSLPSALLIAILCEPFTRALLGARWLPIVPITHALAGFGVMRALGASAGALFLAVGRPDLRAKIQIGQLCVFAGTIYPLFLRYGVLGVALAATLYQLLSVYGAYLGLRLCSVRLRELGRSTLALTLAALFGAAAAFLVARVWLVSKPWPALLAGSAAGVLGTLALLTWLDSSSDDGFRAELANVLRALRKRQA